MCVCLTLADIGAAALDGAAAVSTASGRGWAEVRLRLDDRTLHLKLSNLLAGIEGVSARVTKARVTLKMKKAVAVSANLNLL